MSDYPQSDLAKHAIENMGVPVDINRHNSPDLHQFGEALLMPDDTDVMPTGTVASAGVSPKVARADHVHVGGGGSGGVTDHGALTGLGDDDHPQYTTDVEATAIAGNAVNTHVAAADPHAIYLRIAEILAGANITVTDNGNGTVTIGAANSVQSARAINTTPPLQDGGNLSTDRTLSIDLFTATVKGAVPPPTTAAGKFLRDDGSWQTVAGGITAHSALTGLTAPADDHTQYVKKAGDVMTGSLALPRLDVKDPTSGTGGWATERFYHDNNTDFLAVDVLPTATPGLQVTDSRASSSVLLRVANGEKVSFPANGHQHRWQAAGALASASWGAAGFVQMPLSVRDDPGNLVKSNYILLPDIGYYTANAVVAGMDRAISGITELIIRIVSSSTNDAADIIWTGTAGKLSYSASAAAFFVPAVNAQLQFFVYMPNAMVVAPSASGVLTVSSLF